MFAKSFLVVASAALALASPCIKSATTPTLPVNGGSTELPAPTGTLKHIALGFGIQNYTCSGAGATASATGALAMLYDITDYYPGTKRKSLSQDDFEHLTGDVLDSLAVPLNLVSTGGASATDPFTKAKALKFDGNSFPFLGHHYFNSAGTPTFDLGSELLHGSKSAAVDAPASANPGPKGTGAVAWLYLTDAGSSYGLSSVYRVLTAGGNAYSCSGAGSQSVSYTAQYWFYE